MAINAIFNVDTASMKAYSAMLTKAKAPQMEAFRSTITNEGGQLIGGRAAELASWSKKIPRTIRWRTQSASLYKVTLVVSAGYKGVPIAKWYELGHTQDHSGWWHPAWPHGKRKSWKWVPQAKGEYHRPYLYPALQEMTPKVNQVCLKALVTALVTSVPYMHLTVTSS